MTDTINKLMNAAETRIRSGGYHAMSFRDLADDLGIKSSSVHYYFRRKEDLTVALVERYSENFFTALDNSVPETATGNDRINALCQTYRGAFTTQESVCLCGILGAEKGGLPQNVNTAVGNFLSKNVNWVVAVLPHDLTKQQRLARAEHIIATLQGALVLTKNLSGIEVFDRIVKDLQSAI